MTVKIGLMVPANNTTMEAELRAWMDNAPCHTLRIPRGKGLLGPAEIPAYVAQALELAGVEDEGGGGAEADDAVDGVLWGRHK